VLKVPHHGSRYQEPAFLAAAAPRVAITSVGADNDYGHPSAATENLISSLGAQARRTDRDGDVAVVGTKENLRVVARGVIGAASPQAAPWDGAMAAAVPRPGRRRARARVGP
jgi:competence protein ComEC